MSPSRLPKRSRSVRQSASAWQGWWSSVSALMTGTLECSRSSRTSRWSSSRRSLIGSPPRRLIAASDDPRARVDGLAKEHATERPSSALRQASRCRFIAPARSSSAANCCALRSAMRRCSGRREWSGRSRELLALDEAGHVAGFATVVIGCCRAAAPPPSGRSPLDPADNYGRSKGPLRMWGSVRAATFGT